MLKTGGYGDLEYCMGHQCNGCKLGRKCEQMEKDKENELKKNDLSVKPKVLSLKISTR